MISVATTANMNLGKVSGNKLPEGPILEISLVALCEVIPCQSFTSAIQILSLELQSYTKDQTQSKKMSNAKTASIDK
jgi:hypothetical protein